MTVRYRPVAHAWEAVYTADFTLDQVRRRTASLAEGLASQGLSCVIGYDTRFMGNLFARDIAESVDSLRTSASASWFHSLNAAFDYRVTVAWADNNGIPRSRTVPVATLPVLADYSRTREIVSWVRHGYLPLPQ